MSTTTPRADYDLLFIAKRIAELAESGDLPLLKDWIEMTWLRSAIANAEEDSQTTCRPTSDMSAPSAPSDSPTKNPEPRTKNRTA